MTQPRATRQTARTVAPTAAVLVLDEHGRVELASPGACALWQAAAAELVGEAFPNLFVFDVVSQEAEWLQAQWEVLLAAAAERPFPLKLQPKEAAPFEAIVRLEPAGTQPRRYFAQLAVAPPAAAVTPTGDAVAGALYPLLCDHGPLGFFDLNFVRREFFLSPAWKRQLGHTDASLPSTYESWTALLHPEDTAAAPDRLATRAPGTGARPFQVDYRLRHARGHYVWVQSIGVQVFGPNGALQRVVGAHLDITDRKDFEEASLRAEERMQLLGERGRVAVFDLDFVGSQTWLSPAFKALLGYAATELPDEPDSFLRALPPEETSAGLAAFFTTPHPGQTVFFDPIRLRHRQGAEIWAYAGIVRLISRQHELQRVLGFIAPLPAGTAPAAGPLGTAAPLLPALLDELREAVLLTDGRGRILLLNSAAARLLGLATEQAVGQDAAEVLRLVHRQSGAPGESPLDRALATGEATPLNEQFALEATPGTPPRPIVCSCRAVQDDTRAEPAGAVFVFRDPAEMGLTPEELVRANRFEALGQLAGGIAHDFNNLLTTILGGVSLAKDNRDLSALDNSERACLAAKALSKQLLTFAKGGTGARQVLKLGDLLADALRLAGAGSTVQLALDAPADLAPVLADRAQLLQVFQNLIINAIQAMPTGHGHVWLRAGNVELTDGQIPPLPAGPYVAAEVRDDGAGIPPENLEKIFDPFFTTKKTGTGLGLATVFSIIKRHGGMLGLDSEVGTGTTFTVFLPRAATDDVAVEARRAPTLRHGTGRVLFMDDDPQISTLTAQMLESLGYKCDLATTGEEAIRFYQRYLKIGRPYDLVIMDLTVIGGMGGEQAFKHLRDLDPEVRALVASGYDDEDMARQFLELGFCGYLTKPYRVGDLARIIKQVLGT